MFGTIEAGAPETIGAEISSTTMAKPGPPARRPPRSAHQRVDARKPSPQQRAPAVPIEYLLEALPDAVVLVDAAGQIAYANGLLETLSGYSRGDLFGQLIEFLVPERFRQLHTTHRRGYVANPRARPVGAIASGPLFAPLHPAEQRRPRCRCRSATD